MAALLALAITSLATAVPDAAAVWVFSADGSTGLRVGSDGATMIATKGGNYSLAGAGKTAIAGGTVPSPGSCTASGTTLQTTIQTSLAAATAAATATITGTWRCTVPGVGTGPGTAGPDTEVVVTVADVFRGGATSVAITTTITTDNPVPFTQALRTPLTWASDGGGAGLSTVWTSWGKGCVVNNGKRPGMCFASGAWAPGLAAESLTAHGNGYYRYGTGGRGTNDTFTVPIVTVIDPANDVGVSLVASPEDPVLELSLNTSGGGVVFQRELLRIGGAAPLVFTAHVVAHHGCWRPGLGFFTVAFAPYFDSWAEDAADFEGLGSYSWNQEPYDATRANSIGFKTNWDLSGTWMPYDGLFLPYQEKWSNLGPINGGLAQYNVTYDMINSLYERVQAAGFHSLSYFDIGNWGTQTTTHYRGPTTTCGVRPNGMAAPCPNPAGANEYLRDHLWPALLHHGWDYFHGKWMVHKYDWVGTTDMDTMVPVFEDLIVEQIDRHLTKLPAFEGIAIDRLDYSEFFNYDYDDNVSWIPRNGTGSAPSVHDDLSIWGPARALRLSYRHTFNRLHEKLHPKAVRTESQGPDAAREGHAAAAAAAADADDTRGQAEPADKMMLNNCNLLCRLDEMRAFDGTFSEGAALNGVAWTGVRNPTILWTYGLSSSLPLLDAFFQQHLLMDVYPMAPMPKNDHSINPGDPVVEQAYVDYAPLFNRLHGARWLLTARPGWADGTGAASGAVVDHQVNVLTRPDGGYVAPVMLGNSTATGASVKLTLQLPVPAGTGAALESGPAHDSPSAAAWILTLTAVYPGGKTVELGPASLVPGGCDWQHGAAGCAAFSATVPLVRGCALVLATFSSL